MTEKPRETQAELHVVELKEKVNNSSLMKHQKTLYERSVYAILCPFTPSSDRMTFVVDARCGMQRTNYQAE